MLSQNFCKKRKTTEEEIKISDEPIVYLRFFNAKRHKYYNDKSWLGEYGDSRKSLRV